MTAKKTIKTKKEEKTINTVKKEKTVKEEKKQPSKTGRKSLPKTKVSSELKSIREERDKLNEKNIRLLAEFENFRRRTGREKDELIKYSLKDFLLSLVPVVDDLQRTLESIDNDNPVHDGIQLVKEKFDKVLKKYGVESFDSVGKEFDPESHDAMLIQESNEFDSQVVMQEFEKGYKYHDKILRHAKVVVAK